MEIKDIDICITTYNRTERLKLILDSLSNQTNMSFNLIINDDGSRELINPNNYPIITKYIWNKDYRYNRVARFNESILTCISPLIIILDDDCVPIGNTFINGHIDCLKTADFSKGTIKFPGGKEASSWFSTANLGFHRNLIKEYGLFYPEYNGYYGYEDMDLGEEIKAKKLKVIDNRNAQVMTGSEMYLNGDRSDTVIGRNRSIFEKRWINTQKLEGTFMRFK
jgi:glycosyltransferase involved in cell wall biosynthesis